MADEAEQNAQSAPQNNDEMESMRRELAQLRSEKSTLINQVSEAQGGRATAERRVLSEAEQRLVALESSADNAIVAADNEANALESQLGSLMGEGKFAEAAGIQRKLAQAEARSLQAKGQKDYFASERARVAEVAKQPPRPQPQIADRLLADGRTRLSTFNNSPRTRQWIEDHPECFTKKSFWQKALAAHEEAVEQNIAPESKEYFSYIEQSVGAAKRTDELDVGGTPYSGADQGGELNYQAEKPQTRAAGAGSLSSATPPSRQAAGGTGGSRRAPDLTPEERSAADDLYGDLSPGDRYKKYHEGKVFMNNRRSAQH